MNSNVEMNISQVFKKTPTHQECQLFLSHIIHYIHDKLDPIYIENRYKELMKEHKYTSRMTCLNECIRVSLQECASNIASNLFVGIRKYFKNHMLKI